MVEEVGTSSQPAWLDLPEKSSYWTCKGRFGKPKCVGFWFWKRTIYHIALHIKNFPVGLWTAVFYTKEEAESHSSLKRDSWVWDGLPAQTIALTDALYESRKNGSSGVLVISYQGGEWVIVKEYLAGVPLREVE